MPSADERPWREVPYRPDVLDAWAAAPALDDEPDEARDELRAELGAVLRELVRTKLTDRQRRIVELYFFEGRTQQEVAGALGISQQVVSRQIFGVVREGRRVGGAIKRLRDACERMGVEWV